MSQNQCKLNSQQKTTDQINQLIQQSTDALTCGPNCQKTRKSDSLRQDYMNAQANVETAPYKLHEAEKKYYIYTEGTVGYNAVILKESTKKANQLTTSITNAFQSDVDSAKSLTETYNSLYITYQNTFELYEKYLRENSELQYQINEINTDTITNDRKTYYEGQGYTKLQSWYSLFKWIYIFLLVVYFIGIFLAGGKYSFLSKFGILILLILYPFLINYIVIFIYKTGARIYELFPKNAYTTL